MKKSSGCRGQSVFAATAGFARCGILNDQNSRSLSVISFVFVAAAGFAVTSASGFPDDGHCAPLSIHRWIAAICSGFIRSPFGGIISSAFDVLMRATNWLSTPFPKMIAGSPESPPLSKSAFRSIRSPPFCFSGPWHRKQCSSSNGRTSFSNCATRSTAAGENAAFANDKTGARKIARRTGRFRTVVTEIRTMRMMAWKRPPARASLSRTIPDAPRRKSRAGFGHRNRDSRFALGINARLAILGRTCVLPPGLKKIRGRCPA